MVPRSLIRAKRCTYSTVRPRKDKRLVIQPRLAGALVRWLPERQHLVIYHSGRYVPSAEHLMDELADLPVEALGLLWVPDDHNGRLASTWVRRADICRRWQLWIMDLALPQTPAARRIEALRDTVPQGTLGVCAAPSVEVSSRDAMIHAALSWRLRKPQWPFRDLWGFWSNATLEQASWHNYRVPIHIGEIDDGKLD